ncbi:lachesin-like isoform X1 [Lineus longissimus]|uniref:lachesin-like isoform X1 n=1 Tax=Lineus longissimus TaxID=88925 RepID=UPI002B4C8DB6
MMNLYICVFLGVLTLYVSQANAQSNAQISKAIDQETKTAGATGLLNCTVSGLAAAQGSVLWSKKMPSAKPISRNQQIVRKNPLGPLGQKKFEIIVTYLTAQTQIYTLVNRRLTSDDSGEYTCEIYLPGNSAKDTPKAVGVLVVQLPPSISDSDTTPFQQTGEGTDAKLTCDASGEPPPIISWSRANGRSLPNGMQTIYGTELILKNVTTVDGGVYRCKADNNVRPPATIDVTLLVRTKPVATPFRPAYGQARDLNLEVELACIISGEPTPDLFWFHIKDKKSMSMRALTDGPKHEVNKIPMYPGHNRRETDQWLTLRILQVQSDDYGTYMCMGKNEFGNGSAVMTLYATPTCQGPLCQYQSGGLGAASISVSLVLLLVSMVTAFLTAKNNR